MQVFKQLTGREKEVDFYFTVRIKWEVIKVSFLQRQLSTNKL